MLYKSIFIAILFCNAKLTDCIKMHEVRNLYHLITSEKELNAFIQFTESVNCEEKVPYIASATTLKAKYSNSPIKKLDYFNKGKSILEEYIKLYPNNLEARYIRFLTQKNAPWFLNYSRNIKKDSAFIYRNINKSGLPKEYKEVINNNLTIKPN